MPRFLNTDNGRTVDVLEAEAFIYERASNFQRVPEDKPPPAPEYKAPAPVEHQAKKKA